MSPARHFWFASENPADSNSICSNCLGDDSNASGPMMMARMP